MAQRGGNERYHAHDHQQDDDGPCSGRERPLGRVDARRVGCVARAGGPADMSPLLDAAPAQRRSGGPLRVLLRERRAAQPGVAAACPFSGTRAPSTILRTCTRR